MVLFFIMLYKVVLTFESTDKILWCNHSNESYWAVLSRGTVCYAVPGGSNFWVCGRNPMTWPFKWKLLSSTFPWYCLLCCTRWFLLLSLWTKTYGVTLPFYWAVLSCDTVYYAVQSGSNFCVCGWNPMVWLFKWKLLSSTFLWYFLYCTRRL